MFSLLECRGSSRSENEVIGDVLRLDIQLYFCLAVSAVPDVIPLHA